MTKLLPLLLSALLLMPVARAVSPITSGTAPYATVAQTTALASTSVSLNPSNIPYAMFDWNWRDVVMNSASTSSAAGLSGSAGTLTPDIQDIKSGTTATGYGITSFRFRGLYPDTTGVIGINFDKPCGFVVSLSHQAGTTNGFTRVSMAAQANYGAGGSGLTAKMTGKGIGFELRNGALYTAVHDGTTLSNTSLSKTVAVSEAVTISCFRSAAGSFDYYVNGAFVLTQTGGPTGTSGTSNSIWCALGCDNNGDAANQEEYFYKLTLFQGLQ